MSTVSCLFLSPLSTPKIVTKLTTDSDSRVEKVLVVTSDSRTLVGSLLSCDQMTNLVSTRLVSRQKKRPDFKVGSFRYH